MIAIRHASDAQVRSALSKLRRAHTPLVDDVVRALPAYSSLDDIVRAIGNMGRLSHPCTLIPEYSAAPVVPTDFANLFAWYRADLGITTVSGAVSAWADQSGNGNDLSQSNSSARPSVISASANFNSRTTLLYDTGGFFDLRWLARASLSSSLVTPVTIYAVARSTITTGYVFGTSTTDGARLDIFQSGGKAGITTTAGSPLAASSSAATFQNTTQVICAVFAGAGTSKIYMRSTSVAEASGVTGASTVTAIKGVGMYGGQGDSWKGEIAEVVIYTGSHDGTTTLQMLMQGYFAPRYGLAVS